MPKPTFFRPLHRRIAMTLICVAWLGFEAYQGIGGFWFWLAAGVLFWAIWDFFVSGNYGERAEEAGRGDEHDDR
jgi:hypothetical protein